MRKVVEKDWGEEIIFANEEWFIGKFLSVNFGKSNSYETIESDRIYFINKGLMRMTINGTTYDYGVGKTVLLKKGTKFSFHALSDAEVIEIRKQDSSLAEDFSGGSRL